MRFLFFPYLNLKHKKQFLNSHFQRCKIRRTSLLTNNLTFKSSKNLYSCYIEHTFLSFYNLILTIISFLFFSLLAIILELNSLYYLNYKAILKKSCFSTMNIASRKLTALFYRQKILFIFPCFQLGSFFFFLI